MIPVAAIASLALALVGAAPVFAVATVPGPPTDVHGVWTSSDGERTFVDWTPPADDGGAMLLGYALRATADNGSTWIDLGWNDECTPQEPSCVPESDKIVSYSLTQFTTYRFSVRAHNEVGWGPWSAMGQPFTTNPGGRVRPLAPRDVTAIADDHAILLRWSAPPDPYGMHINYEIQWTPVGTDFTGTRTAWTDAHSYLITGLDETKAWAVRIETVRAEAEFSLWKTLTGIRMADNPQRIVNFDGLPRAIARNGRTQILPCGVHTNTGHQVRAYLTWTGPTWRRVDADAVVVKRSACGGVAVITKGQPVRVTVGLWATPAPPKDGFLAVRIYRTWDSPK